MIGRTLCAIGIIAILHAAFSYAHYKDFTRGAGGGSSDGLPFDVLAEVGGGFVVCLLGALVSGGKMEPARSTSGLTDTTFDFHMARADFILYNHRGKSLKKRVETAANR